MTIYSALSIEVTLLAVFAPALHAIQITVSTTEDDPSKFTRAMCMPSGVRLPKGHCTLRNAIELVNQWAAATAGFLVHPQAFTITVPAGSYYLLPNQSLDVGPALVTIKGAGKEQTRIYANGDRVFDIKAGAEVTVQGVAISDGMAVDGGGGIRNAGVLIVTDASVESNTTQNADGGGILNLSVLTVVRSHILRNRSYQYGGGISNYGAIT